ncbi:MAG: DUF3299 domain-containing protein [Aliishimia sp.]
MNRHLKRRILLGGMATSSLLPGVARAQDYVDLNWEDLIPKGQSSIPSALFGLLPHDEQMPITSEQPVSSGVRTDWNDQIVRLPGFIIPIDFQGTGVTAFILVPFVGACIHVPPPPANQLVFVTTPEPYEGAGMFEAVSVIGKFAVSSLRTHLADIGYALSADEIQPYRA